MHLQIIRVRDYIKLSLPGKLDFNAARKAISEVSSLPNIFYNYNLLIDSRNSESELTVTEISAVAIDLASLIHKDNNRRWTKIPVLCPDKNFDKAKFFEICSQNRGLNVRAFTSFEEMYNWLVEPSILKLDDSAGR